MVSVSAGIYLLLPQVYTLASSVTPDLLASLPHPQSPDVTYVIIPPLFLFHNLLITHAFMTSLANQRWENYSPWTTYILTHLFLIKFIKT